MKTEKKLIWLNLIFQICTLLLTHVVVETKSSANEVDTMSSGMKIQISSTYYKTFYIFSLKKKEKKKNTLHF
jgi:hypothetical protein